MQGICKQLQIKYKRIANMSNGHSVLNGHMDVMLHYMTSIRFLYIHR